MNIKTDQWVKDNSTSLHVFSNMYKQLEIYVTHFWTELWLTLFCNSRVQPFRTLFFFLHVPKYSFKNIYYRCWCFTCRLFSPKHAHRPWFVKFTRRSTHHFTVPHLYLYINHTSSFYRAGNDVSKIFSTDIL